MVSLPEVCVVYLVRTREGIPEVLLGRKKTGLGMGKLVGLGGKLEAGESPADAVVREAFEEAGLIVDPADLRSAGVIDYWFPTKPSWSQRSHVFVARAWQGEPVETDELVPAWFAREQIPYDSMWDDARLWLPGVIAGGTVTATYTFGADLNSVVSTAR